MNCEKCGKEIPEGENKLCEDCKKNLVQNIENESNEVESKDTPVKEEFVSNVQKEETKKNSNNKKYFVLGIIVVLIVAIICGIISFINGWWSDIFKTEGNTISNIRNYGYTAKDGSWIYYVAPSADGKKVAIYKSKMDGSNRQTLLQEDWDILGLNVKDNYLYFIAISDAEVESNSDISISESLDSLDNKIYRMKTDGTDLKVINNNGFHNNCYEIYVIDDKVYFIGVDQNIYCMNTDGSDVKRMNEDESGFLGITKDYIIFNVGKEVENITSEDVESEEEQPDTTTEFETFIMKRDGTDRHSITGERLFSVNVIGDYIYYVNLSKQIYKVKLDGTDNTLISDTVQAYNLNVSDNYIYYMSYIDTNMEKIGIYRMNLDGSDSKVIYELENYSSFLNVVDDHIVFMDNNDEEGTINLIDSEGQNRVKLYNLTYEDYLNGTDNNETEVTTEDANTDQNQETSEVDETQEGTTEETGNEVE